MLFREICPDCGKTITAERMDEEMIICECGYTFSQKRIDMTKETNKKASYTIIFTGLFLVTAFIHTAKWGGDAVKVTPLEMSRVLGTISSTQALHLGEISLEKGYFHQAIQMFELFLKSNPEDVAVNEKMALLLYQTEQFEESLPYFNAFRSLGGETKETLYSYGKALTHNQNFTDAEDVFLSLVRAYPEVYQVTVVQALVNLYIEQDKLNEANKFMSTLVRRGYEIPPHLIEQRQHIKSLMNKKS